MSSCLHNTEDITTVHNVEIAQISPFPLALPRKEVYDWLHWFSSVFLHMFQATLILWLPG